MNSESKLKENIIPGDLPREVNLDIYNEIVYNNNFIQESFKSGNKRYIIIENSNIYKLINDTILSLKNKEINIVPLDRILEIEDIAEIECIFIQTDILTSDLSILLGEICKKSVTTKILTIKPELFLEYSILNDSLELSFFKSNLSLREIIFELLIHPIRKKSEIKITKNTKPLQKIFNVLDKNIKRKIPFYRFDEKYLIIESLGQNYKDLLVEGRMNQLFEGKDYGWMHKAFIFINYTEMYGLKICIDKISHSTNTNKLLLSVFVLRLLVEKGNDILEVKNLTKKCFDKIEMAFMYRYKVGTEHVKNTLREFQANKCKNLNSFKVKDRIILSEAGLVSVDHNLKYNFFTTLLNTFYIDEIRSNNSNNLNREKADLLMEQFNRDNRCKYALDIICRNNPTLLCSKNNFSNQPAFEAWATHISCFLIIYKVPDNLYNDIKELFILKNFNYPNKYLILKFFFLKELPFGFANFSSFYRYVFSECNKSLYIMCTETNYGIPDPLLPIFCSFVKTYGTDAEYMKICYQIFSLCPSYNWVFNKCCDSYFENLQIVTQ